VKRRECFHGDLMACVGDIFKDPVIRWKENPYFDLNSNQKPV